jgi:hypothetical protein
MNNERQPGGSHELSPEKAKELENAGLERKAELEKSYEQSGEKSPDHDLERSRQEALEAAAKQEKDRAPAEKTVEKPHHLSPASRRAREKASFKKTMQETQEQMSLPSRSFSKLIHTKAVEKTSEALGSTLARPNAILAGSVTAFVLTLGLYLFARYYGYPLSGFETIGSFILGWILGILFDYLRVMITGKKA